jgi:hypothetical protein
MSTINLLARNCTLFTTTKALDKDATDYLPSDGELIAYFDEVLTAYNSFECGKSKQ